MLTSAKNPDPFALGKYQRHTNQLKMAAWLFLLFCPVLWVDSNLVERLENETVLELHDKIEYVSTGNRYGGSKARSYFVLETQNLNMRFSVRELAGLDLKPGDRVIYHRTPLFHQKVRLVANGQMLAYYTVAEAFFYLLVAQGVLALLGLVGFIPGQVRVMSIVISGLLTLFFVRCLI